MFVDAGRPTGGALAHPVHLDEAGRHRRTQSGNHLGIREGSAGRQVLVGQHLLGPQHRGAHDAAALRLGRDLFHRHVGEVCLVGGRQHVGGHEAVDELFPVRVRELLRLAHPFPERPPLPRREDDQAHEAALATVDRVDRAGPVAGLAVGRVGRSRDARVGVGPVGRLGDAEGRREVDVLADPGREALVERRRGRERGGDGCNVVAETRGRCEGCLRRDPRLVHHPADGGEDGVRRDPVTVGAEGSEGRERRDDEVRVALPNDIGSEAMGRGPTVRAVVDENVGSGELGVEGVAVALLREGRARGPASRRCGSRRPGCARRGTERVPANGRPRAARSG